LREAYETQIKKKKEVIDNYKLHGFLDELPLHKSKFRSIKSVEPCGKKSFLIKSVIVADYKLFAREAL